MRVSIIMNVIDRYGISQKCVKQAVQQAKYSDWEFLVCDNGSTDPQIRPWIKGLPNLAYLHANSENRGNYQMLNQLLLRASGDAFCVIDPDIWLPTGWLRALVETNQKIPSSGISGIHCVAHRGTRREIDGVGVRYRPNGIFGTKFWNRKVLDKIGYFCEDYGPYGFGDGDYGLRSRLAGFNNYYLADMKSTHAGDDVSTKTGYRKMKNESLKRAQPIASANYRRYREKGEFYVPPPRRIDGF
jgi:glycosyltransferase involved in cell wall biosynthesis